MNLKTIFKKLAYDVTKFPNIVQLSETLSAGFKDVADNIDGGGGGSSVEIYPTQLSGNKIASIFVDGEGNDIYAPDPSLSISGHTLNLYKGTTIDIPSSVELPGDTVSVNPIQTTGTIIAEVTVNNVTSQIKAPSAVAPTHNYSTTPQIVGKWIDGTSDVYEVTINLTTPITIHYNSWTSTTIDASDMDIILNCRGISVSGVPSADVIASTDNDYIECQTARNGVDMSDVKYFIITYVKLS